MRSSWISSLFFCHKNVIGYNKLIDLFCTVLIYNDIGFMGMKGTSSLNPTNISLNISQSNNYVWINSNYRLSSFLAKHRRTSKISTSDYHVHYNLFIFLMVRQRTFVHWGALTHIDENFRKIDGWDMMPWLKSCIYLLSSYIFKDEGTYISCHAIWSRHKITET